MIEPDVMSSFEFIKQEPIEEKTVEIYSNCSFLPIKEEQDLSRSKPKSLSEYKLVSGYNLLSLINSGKLKVICDENSSSDEEKKFDVNEKIELVSHCDSLPPSSTSEVTSFSQHNLTSDSASAVCDPKETVGCCNERFFCDFCQKNYGDRGSLKRHIEAVHLKLRPFNCFYCGFSSPRKDNLKKHIIANHIKERVFGCKHCSYKAGSKYHLIRHHETTVHNNNNLKSQFYLTVYSCAYCKEWTTYHKRVLKNHIISQHSLLFNSRFEAPAGRFEHTNKRRCQTSSRILHKCPLCTFSTKTRSRVEDHINAKHKFVKPHACKLCSYRSSNRESLKRHIFILHNQKYSCSLCSFTFKSKTTLNEHVNKYHSFPGNRYLCHYCYQSYHTKHNLCKHLKLCHKNKFC